MNILAELSTKEISEGVQPHSFDEHNYVDRKGGTIAGNACMELEQKTGKAVVSSVNAKDTLPHKNEQIIDSE